MSVLIVGEDKNAMLLEMAARRISNVGSGSDFGPAMAVGVASGHTKADRLWATVIFHEYRQKERTCQISCVAWDPRWASRRTIREILKFPFLQYQCFLVWTATPHTSQRVIDFNKAIGFKQEAVLAHRFGPGNHATIMRMTFDDFRKRYLKEGQDGKEVTVTAARA